MWPRRRARRVCGHRRMPPGGGPAGCVGRGGHHRRGHRTRREARDGRDREGHRRIHIGLLADLVLPARSGGVVGAAGQRPRREERAGAVEDKLDAVWLAKVAERGMCRPSLVHPPEIRRLRDLTRYRRALVGDRARERQRVEKLLEDAQIKIGTVLTDIHGVSGRAMMEALISAATGIHARWRGWPPAGQSARPPTWKRRCADSSPAATRSSCG